MEYQKITIRLTPACATASEVMMAQMGDLGYESFVETPDGFEAYIPTPAFDPEALAGLDPMVEGVGYRWQAETIADQNWNKVWEQNFFEPIVIGGKCQIRSTFHKPIADTEYEIIINPQMAFGTGHHQTTELMITFLADMDLHGQSVLDMGCGTGILGIFASMRGAAHVHGIDIDTWCRDNSLDNIALNSIGNMTVAVGDASAIDPQARYDTILANINRNILLADMPRYAAALAPGGTLLLSGFYADDVPMLRDAARQLGLELADSRQKDSWTALKLTARH